MAVKVIVVLDIALGVLILLAETLALVSRRFMVILFPAARFGAPALVTFSIPPVIAVIDFILAYGIWSGMKWAWYSSLAFSLLGIVAAAIILFVRPRAGQVLSLIIDLVIVYLLMQPGVHQYFTKSSRPLTPGGMPSTTSGVAVPP